MNIQTQLKLERLQTYLDRLRDDLEYENLPAAMADSAEVGEQARRLWNFLAELERHKYSTKARSHDHRQL